MSQNVKRQASVDSSPWLDSYRKSFATLRRAIPKQTNPRVRVEAVDGYSVRIIAEWSEWV